MKCAITPKEMTDAITHTMGSTTPPICRYNSNVYETQTKSTFGFNRTNVEVERAPDLSHSRAVIEKLRGDSADINRRESEAASRRKYNRDNESR